METKTSPLKRSTTLTIKNNSYDVTYPNTGQSMDIALLIAKISDGNYDILRFSTSSLLQEQADKIDMVAVFNILIPTLKKDLTVKSLFDLSEEQSDELLAVYTEQFLPWFNPIKNAIKNPKSQTEKDEK